MQASWLEALAGLSLGCFHLVLVGLVMLAIIRARSAPGARGAPPRGGRLGRLLVEYVGNLDDPTDRRRNERGRAFVDWVKEKMEEHDFSTAQEEELLEGVRSVVREEAWIAAEVRSAEVGEDRLSNELQEE